MDTDEVKERLWRRRGPLYTWGLTPLFEVSDVLAAILFPGESERARQSDIYPWFYRLDEKRREELIDYCAELDCWHEELEFAAGDLETAMESTYSSEIYGDDTLHYRRLALIYHSDNVDHRIYAYREKVFQLASLFLDDVTGSNKPEDFRTTVRDALRKAGYGRVVTLFDNLEDQRKAPSVVSALRRRRQLIHARAIRESKSLQARRRIEEFIEEFVAGLSQVDELEQLANLEALIKEGRENIEQVCATLAAFRVELVQALKDVARR